MQPGLRALPVLLGQRDPRELSTRQCMDIVDELERMQVFYVNIGGGEPTVRPDFWELVDYATAHHVGVKFSTNGVRITPEVAARLAASDYVDVQISLDGATAEVNDAVRGPGSFAMAVRALENLAAAGFKAPRSPWWSPGTMSTSSTNSPHWRAVTVPPADHPAASLGAGRGCLGRATPHRRAAALLYDWLVAKGERVLTGDSFFHLAPLGHGALPV